jgi:hypothetical protein
MLARCPDNAESWFPESPGSSDHDQVSQIQKANECAVPSVRLHELPVDIIA